MKYLIIRNGQGFFMNFEEQEKKIDSIAKDDILFLLRKATDADTDFEMDVIEQDNIKNEAEKIIYENIYIKFQELLKNKNVFIDESRAIYKEAFAKYRESK